MEEVWLDIPNRGRVRCTAILPHQDGSDWSYRLREVGCDEDLEDGMWVPQNEELTMAKRGPNNPKYLTLIRSSLLTLTWLSTCSAPR